MKVKVGTLKAVVESLGEVLHTVDLPVSVSWNLGKVAKQLVEESKQADEAHMKLIEKYAERGVTGDLFFEEAQNGGRSYKISPDNLGAFQKDVDELYNIEIDLDLAPISVKELDGKIKGKFMLALMDFFCE